MENKNLNLMYKIFLLIGLFIIISWLLCMGFRTFIGESLYVILRYILIFLTVIDIFMVIVLFILKDLSSSKKFEKNDMSFNNYDTLYNLLENSLIKDNYSRYKKKFLNDYEIIVYAKEKELNELDCIVLLYVGDFSDILLRVVDLDIKDVLDEKVYNKKKKYKFDLTMIVCVDRTNYAFKKFVNEDFSSKIKNNILPIGISFGKNKIYIKEQIDYMCSPKYKRRLNYILNIINRKSR